jgi:dTDP-4-amino-4,6-dideoxygalactose transaminase
LSDNETAGVVVGVQVETGTALAIEGGTPVRTRPWPTYDQGDAFVGQAEEDAVVRVVRSRRLFRYDTRPYAETEVGRFESRLCEYFGTRHALAVSSGTTALALSLMAAGIGPGHRVACPVFTFAATPSAILLAGATPVMVAVDRDLHVDLEALAAVLPSVDAVMVVHMRGFAEDMDAIVALAATAGVPVFEDGVPALGVRLRGRPLGTFGLTGSFSSQSDKAINTGEGGFLVTDDTGLAARATVLAGAYEGRVRRHFGPVPLDDLSLPLYSFRMDELRGAVASAQLDVLPIRLQRMATNYARVAGTLAEFPWLRLREPVDSGALLGDSLLCYLPGAAQAESDWFARALRAEGIAARTFGDCTDPNVRAFWNWRFLPEVDVHDPGHVLADSARYVAATVDIPLSGSLDESDCADLVTAIDRVGRHLRTGRAAA